MFSKFKQKEVATVGCIFLSLFIYLFIYLFIHSVFIVDLQLMKQQSTIKVAIYLHANWRQLSNVEKTKLVI